MAAAKSRGKTAGVSDAAVADKTGRTWPQWLKTLDAAGARTGKSQVTLQHGKLPNAREAERRKMYWREQLRNLKTYLEG